MQMMEWWYQSAEERMSAPTVYPPPPPPPAPKVRMKLFNLVFHNGVPPFSHPLTNTHAYTRYINGFFFQCKSMEASALNNRKLCMSNYIFYFVNRAMVS